jgi:dolichyl-phosphate beta-glucosyltransferase
MKNRTVHTPAVTLVIPVYNETVRLISGLYQVLTYLSSARFSWEIIIVDDGSKIPVSKVLFEAKNRKMLHFPISQLPVRVHRLDRNYGKGKAIAAGVAQANGHFIVFTDADLSVPVSELAKTIRLLKKYPIVIASRRTKKANIVVHQSIMRESAGRIFTILSNLFFDLRVADATCGFKGFQKTVARELFTKSRIHRWVFDTEILFLARKYRYAIYQMPVDWTNKSGSRVRAGDGMSSLIDLFRIRWYEVRGMYNKVTVNKVTKLTN